MNRLDEVVSAVQASYRLNPTVFSRLSEVAALGLGVKFLRANLVVLDVSSRVPVGSRLVQ